MLNIGDKVPCLPTFAGEWRGYKAPTGTVIQLYDRFAVVQFPAGYRECYFYNGPDSI